MTGFAGDVVSIGLGLVVVFIVVRVLSVARGIGDSE